LRKESFLRLRFQTHQEQGVGAPKIYVAAVEAIGKRKDRMKLSLPSKLVEKLVWKKERPR